jgi:tetratricopeptide (TPR) repeat protein
MLLFAAVVLLGHAPLNEEVRDLSARIVEAPERADLWLERAAVYLRAGDARLAATDVERAEALAPASAEAASWRGRVQQALGDRAGALAAYDRALAISPSPRAYALRAALHAELGRVRAAIDDYRAALALAPSLDAYLALAALLPAGEAAAACEEGMARLGGAVVLRAAAFDAELRAGRPLGALALADEILPALDVAAEWRLRRAEA